MARIFTSGFELNTNTAGVEWTTTSGSPTIVSSGQRTGNYVGEITSLASGTAKYWAYQFISADSSNQFWFRAYLYLSVLPNGNTSILTLYNSSNNNSGDIRLTSAGSIGLFDNSGAQVGSGMTLSTGQWYLVEMMYDNNTAACELKVNGSVVATETSGQTDTISTLRVGGNIAANGASAGTWYLDDIAINDSTGSSQNGYAGAGAVASVRVDAAGDSNTFATQTGGTAGSANNYTRVDETTPDDATSYNGSNTLNQSDLYAVTNLNLPTGSTVNCVQVNVRFRGSSSSANASFKVQAEKTSGGTKSSSAAITPSNTTFVTNATAVPDTPPLTMYTDPDGGAWTPATIGSMQIGMIISTGNTNRADISTIWANVDYIPGANANGNFLALL